nr:MAG TPA: hypothetical protein [Herelleviridae sp.]
MFPPRLPQPAKAKNRIRMITPILLSYRFFILYFYYFFFRNSSAYLFNSVSCCGLVVALLQLLCFAPDLLKAFGSD